MLNIITIPGINKDKVTAVNIKHCHQLLPRDVSGLFVINLKTKQFVYCKSSSPYAYASEIRKSYKKASTTVQEFINGAQSLNDVYAIFPKVKFSGKQSFPLSGYQEYKKLNDKPTPPQEAINVFKVQENHTNFVYYALKRLEKPRASMMYALRALGQPKPTDIDYTLRTQAIPKIKAALDNIAALSKNNISPVSVRITDISIEGNPYQFVENLNKETIRQWLTN